MRKTFFKTIAIEGGVKLNSEQKNKWGFIAREWSEEVSKLLRGSIKDRGMPAKLA